MRNVSFQRYRFTSPRAGKGSRLVVDLFGPLIDISALDFLSGIPGSRSATLDQIVDSLNVKSETWTRDDLVERLISALQNWDYYDKLMNLPAIDSLNRALGRDAEVVVLTTTEEEGLAEAAKEALQDAFCRVSGSQDLPEHFRFKSVGKDQAAWSNELSELMTSPRYTYVIHDQQPPLVISNLPAPGKENSLHDEWFGSPDPSVLDKLIEEALEREVRFSPLAWLAKREEISLKSFEAVGQFLVHDATARSRIKEQVELIRQRARKDGKPATVVLGGPSGSGKSFFAEEFIRQYGEEIAGNRDKALAVWDLSSVWDLRTALDEHLHHLVAKESAFALLDEVDTIVDGRAAFRFLMRPMSGKMPLGAGRGQGIKIPVRVWFMAGSVGGSRLSWINKMSAVDRKVEDWSNRIFQWVELPATESFQALVQAAGKFYKGRGASVTVDRIVLAYFALAEWRDVRHLNNYAELVLEEAGTTRALEVKHLQAVIKNIESDRQLVDRIEPIATGQIKVTE